MRRIFSCSLFIIATWVFVPTLVLAGSGFYISGEIGANFAPGLDTTGFSTDRASVCDEFINPDFATVTDTPGYENSNCTGPNRGVGDDWQNEFDGATGILGEL